jgi:hypothetical protein
MITHFIQTNLIRVAKPVYPVEAVRKGVDGEVKVVVLVDAEGHIFKSCPISGPEELAKPAANAALQLLFKPRPGSKRYVREVILYRFSLDRKPDTGPKPYILVQPE